MEYNQILKKVALLSEANIWLYTGVLMLIMTAKTIEGVKSHCSSSPVRNGTKATITCHFDVDLSLNKNKVYVEHFGLNGESVEAVVVCHWSRVHYTCNTRSEYKVVGNVSRQLSVEIPKALKEHSGKYWCNIYKSESTGFKRCDLRITIPSRVTRLTVDGQSTQSSAVVQRNKSVSVVCSWENGEPPSTVRLIGNNGKQLLTTSNISGNVVYQFLPAHCNDTGILYCEAAGSENNLSTTLLVECPPTFTSSTPVFYAKSVNHTVKLDFPVRIHSPYITKCQLIHYAEDFSLSEERLELQTFVTYPCDVNKSGNVGMAVPILRNLKCNCHLNGVLPDLIMSIYIYNITTDNSKRWRLMVFNSVGFEKVDFSLHQAKGPPEFVNRSYEMNLKAGKKNVLFNFSLRMHSTVITKCHISKYTKKLDELENTHVHSVYITYQCKIPPLVTVTSDDITQGSSCQCIVNGTEPDLVLHFVMFNVVISNDERWCVTLFNSNGSDHVDLFLHITNETIKEADDITMIISTSTSSSVLVCIIAIITAIRFCLRKDKKRSDESMQKETQEMATLEVFSLDADYIVERLQEAVNTYEDIQDTQEDKETSTLRKSTIHHIEVCQDDQYLQPLTVSNYDYITPVSLSTSPGSIETANTIYET